MGPLRDSHAPSWLSGPRTDVPTEPPSHSLFMVPDSCRSQRTIQEWTPLKTLVYFTFQSHLIVILDFFNITG